MLYNVIKEVIIVKQMWVEEIDREKFKFYAHCKGYSVPELFEKIVTMLGVAEIEIDMNDKTLGGENE